MIGFKQFLKEMPSLIGVSKYASLSKVNISKLKKISKHKDYDLYHNENNNTYIAHSPKSGHLRIKLKDDNKGNKYVSMVRKSPKFKQHAHEIYHHLITKHNIPLSSDSLQSKGAQQTWRKLLDYGDIQVTTHKGEEVDHSNFDSFYTEKKSNTTFRAIKR